MSTETVRLGPAPLGHCGYCGKAVYTPEQYWIVPTIVGDVRLCDLCAAREPYALATDRDHWLHGTSVPEHWRKAPKAGKGKHRGSTR